MFEDEDEVFEPDLIEMTDDEGNTITMQVLDYFFYNGDEYVILTDDLSDEEDEDAPEGIDCYVMKVNTSTDENGEEMEEFVPIDDPELESKLIEIASSRLNEEDEEEEE